MNFEKISCMNSMSDEECIMLETWNSREALHAHIGNCFPAYSKMMAYCEMNEMFCICDSAEDVEFYKKELAVWGPKRVSQCLVLYSDIQIFSPARLQQQY